jgi:hypothetical protein
LLFFSSNTLSSVVHDSAMTAPCYAAHRRRRMSRNGHTPVLDSVRSKPAVSVFGVINEICDV